MPKAKKDKIVFYGTGRRKSSIARVRLVEGTGSITINNKNIDGTYLFHKFENILKTLPIDNNIISEYGEYSVNTIYELSNELLDRSNADLVLFTLGDKNEDICYMCVGDIDGIHVYKNKINIKDDKMIENLTKTAIFYLIRKLKQNNLQFI